MESIKDIPVTLFQKLSLLSTRVLCKIAATALDVPESRVISAYGNSRESLLQLLESQLCFDNVKIRAEDILLYVDRVQR